MTQAEFERVGLFAELPADQAANLMRSFQPRHYPAGTILFHEGDLGDRMYIILSGEIGVYREVDPTQERILRTRGVGEFVGEMSFLSVSGHRSASAEVISDTHVIELTRVEFDLLLEREPSLAYQMLRIVTGRLREANDAAVHDLRAKNQQLAQAYADLQAAQARLIEQERLEHEMRLAREIQESMHPAALPSLPGYNIGACIVPAREVAGDFFDVFQLDDDTLGILIGDVCGKGVPAALYMAQTRSLIRVEAACDVPPDATLRRANQHLQNLNDNSGLFVTVLYGIVRGATGEFVYARAGHELPLVWLEHGELIHTPHGVGHPLGLLPDPQIDSQTIELTTGKSILLYTDGATEATNDAGEFFDKERLGFFARQPGQNAQQICNTLADVLDQFRGTMPQADDITLLVLRA